MPPSTTQACALDWESNQEPFGLQAGTQSTDPHQPGTYAFFLYFCNHSHSNINTKNKTNKIELEGVLKLIKDEFRSTRI